VTALLLPQCRQHVSLLVRLLSAQIQRAPGGRAGVGDDLPGHLQPRQALKAGTQNLMPGDDLLQGRMQICQVEPPGEPNAALGVIGATRLLQNPEAFLLGRKTDTLNAVWHNDILTEDRLLEATAIHFPG
jgi:hypothetical protein